MFESIKAKLKKEYYMRLKKFPYEEYKYLIWREQGMNLGKNVHIYSDLFSKEPYMISIGDNTTISGNVTLVTHDNSISKYLPQYTDTFGRIKIGKDCFIGMGAIILPGVTIADKCIVAAGAVVTKSILTPGFVVGGAPAHVICDVNTLKQKNERYGFNIKGLSMEEKKRLIDSHPERLVKR